MGRQGKRIVIQISPPPPKIALTRYSSYLDGWRDVTLELPYVGMPNPSQRQWFGRQAGVTQIGHPVSQVKGINYRLRRNIFNNDPVVVSPSQHYSNIEIDRRSRQCVAFGSGQATHRSSKEIAVLGQ